ncbi:hypothetical protein N7491_004814 [Penicillium cf. griseofulvum]|uniref:Uncharacterized protein n=1 Tax=Penicillium cf. griseofulvum TaxID=2972120 RepID=A0A9W9J6E1_9EURO|nr:hypothetical protein N7472_007505 [Penicillium cf. griseofulvum]KAJ5434219.1 hypothetical protein N7491_004814 [Penicillium cf. griseofulvum]KAJ5452046.1 hypothetical protein N7445_000229 [Penicillium cf. griseofulvum]
MGGTDSENSVVDPKPDWFAATSRSSGSLGPIHFPERDVEFPEETNENGALVRSSTLQMSKPQANRTSLSPQVWIPRRRYIEPTRTKKMLQSFLQTASNDVDVYAKHVATSTKKTVMFAFSGQGCLYFGAAAKLFERASLFRDLVPHLNRIVPRLGFPAILTTVAGAAGSIGPAKPRQRECGPSSEVSHDSVALDDSVTSTDSTMPTVESLLVTQLALVQYWGFRQCFSVIFLR